MHTHTHTHTHTHICKCCGALPAVVNCCGFRFLTCSDSGSRHCSLELKPFVHLNPIPLNVSQLHSPNSSVSQHWPEQQQSLNNLSASYSLNGGIHLSSETQQSGNISLYHLDEESCSTKRAIQSVLTLIYIASTVVSF